MPEGNNYICIQWWTVYEFELFVQSLQSQWCVIELCVSFLQEWCCTRRHIITTQLGAWYKSRHWVGWYLLDCKLEQSISCTQCLNTRLMTAVTHRLPLCWLSNHHYIILCCLEVHEVEKLHAECWEGYMYSGTCQDSHLWASLIVWPFSVFSPEFWNRGVQGVEYKALVSNPVPILHEHHYCAIDCCVLVCV